MITATWLEATWWSLAVFILGAIVWDLIWTWLVPDPAAAAHFQRDSMGQRIVWVGGIVFVVLSILSWIY